MNGVLRNLVPCSSTKLSPTFFLICFGENFDLKRVRIGLELGGEVGPDDAAGFVDSGGLDVSAYHGSAAAEVLGVGFVE